MQQILVEFVQGVDTQLTLPRPAMHSQLSDAAWAQISCQRVCSGSRMDPIVAAVWGEGKVVTVANRQYMQCCDKTIFTIACR